MRLTVVGCSGSYPGPDSPASCYLLEADNTDAAGERRTWRILLDLGSGALGALHRYADPLTIDAVLLSHLHADHCLDLAGYYVLRKYHPTGPQPRIPVWGPVGTADRMARACDVQVGPFSVRPVPVDHPVPAFGLRVAADGVTIAYSGDTGPCVGLDDVAQDADLLLAEASFRSCEHNPGGLHLTGPDCGDVAGRRRAKRLLPTHVPPWHDPQ